MIEDVMKALEVKEEDSNRKAIIKTIGTGLVEGFAIVGALHFVDALQKSIIKK